MTLSGDIADDVLRLRQHASQLVDRLGLAGFDNASILAADAWVDSAEFRGAAQHGDALPSVEVGAYLGEAIIRRHGGKWSFSDEGAFVELNRKGRLTVVDPFGKVRKRARNGEIDQLLALVDLVEHVAPPRPAAVVCEDALRAMEASSPPEPVAINGLRFMAYAALALIAVPLVILVVLLLTIDTTYALLGGACGVPLGLVGMVVALAPRRRRQPLFAPPSLAWEAQLTLPPLMAKLTQKLNELGPQSHQRALDEIAFYTAQLREVQAVVDARDCSPGRGYIGYRTFGAPAGRWTER